MHTFLIILALIALIACPELALAADATSLDLPAAQVAALEKALPAHAPVKPKTARKVLIYGRVPTHPDCVRFSAKSLELLAKKTGAFEVVLGSDPAVFLPENLKQFDAVVMNNTHEARPMLPADYKQFDRDKQKQVDQQEAILQKSLLEFVESGKGIIGLHAAAAGVKWPEYEKVLGGSYGGHFSGPTAIKAEDPKHPLCASIGSEGIQIQDEIYCFKGAYSREKLEVLLSVDLSKTKDPEKRPDRDYPISWIRRQGKGRVFYCSVPAHTLASYQNAKLMEHVLAGIQWAIGDLEIK